MKRLIVILLRALHELRGSPERPEVIGDPAGVVSLAVIVFLLCALSAQRCAAKEDVITFNDHIKPILRRHCLKCHGNDEQKADLNLQTYATLLRGGSGGAVVRPGRPQASLLYQAITSDDDAARMPLNSPPIPDKQVELIRNWIATGLRETSGSKSLAPSRTITFTPPSGAAMKPDGPPPMPRTLPELDAPSLKRRLPVVAMAANPWSELLAVSGYQHIRLYHIATRKEIGALAFPEGIPHVLRFSRNGAVLLAAGGKPVQSGSVVLFDVRTGKRLAQLGDELDAVMAADISPDQQLVALGGSGRVVKVYSTREGNLVYKLTRHTDWITSIGFSPDGKQLASADRAGGIHLWEASSGGIRLSLTNHKAAVRTLAWRSDSKVIASGGEDGRLTWWNAQDGFITISHANPHPPARPKGSYGKLRNGVLSVSFAANGHLLSSGRDLHVRYWNPSGKQTRNFQSDAIPTHVVISHDGKKVVAGTATGQLRFWDLNE